jgi:large subunit ribosomal protein L6
LSRLGKIPIKIPNGVQVKINGQHVEVKGPKGTLTRDVSSKFKVEVKDNAIHISPLVEGEEISSLWGLNRVLLANIVEGVATGFTRTLDIVGVGYKAELKGKDLSLSVGYSEPKIFKAPKGITFTVAANVRITVEGIEKEIVGQTTAEIRNVRPPEPYKGKGIRYTGEYVRRKAGKTAVAKAA